MKEHPILFSGPMVRAIQEGRKSQTRRIMQVQPPDVSYTLALLADTTCSKDRRNIRKCRWANYEQATKYFSCPYGKTGDGLWVRETWAANTDITGHIGIAYKADGQMRQAFYHDSGEGELAGTGKIVKPWGEIAIWKPSIFMPREACRIKLEVLGIRVQRLQEISEEDALAEGVYGDESPYGQATPTMCFKAGWDKINGKRGSWESNPWVWVVEFKQIKGEKL